MFHVSNGLSRLSRVLCSPRVLVRTVSFLGAPLFFSSSLPPPTSDRLHWGHVVGYGDGGQWQWPVCPANPTDPGECHGDAVPVLARLGGQPCAGVPPGGVRQTGHGTLGAGKTTTGDTAREPFSRLDNMSRVYAPGCG
jgi:hypothetical protein